MDVVRTAWAALKEWEGNFLVLCTGMRESERLSYLMLFV